jgi:hypothetical protein
MAEKKNSPRNTNPGVMFRKHLAYELETAATAFWRCRQGLPQEFLNVYHESFCLHVRNLLDFFTGKASGKYPAAADFVKDPNAYTRPQREHGNEIDTMLGKLNIEISHLNWGRPDDSVDQIGSKEREDMMNVLRREVENWVPHLSEQFDANNLPLQLLKVAPTPLSVAQGTGGSSQSSSPVGWPKN